MASQPSWVISFGGEDAAFLGGKVKDVELLSDGRVAVVDEFSNEIMVFDSAGGHVATWGGTGDGPGEFRRLDWLGVIPPESLAGRRHSLGVGW